VYTVPSRRLPCRTEPPVPHTVLAPPHRATFQNRHRSLPAAVQQRTFQPTTPHAFSVRRYAAVVLRHAVAVPAYAALPGPLLQFLPGCCGGVATCCDITTCGLPVVIYATIPHCALPVPILTPRVLALLHLAGCHHTTPCATRLYADPVYGPEENFWPDPYLKELLAARERHCYDSSLVLVPPLPP